ncbi:DUF4136 domain-containing protein [Hymenobacter negativus]|uniref:DUF4136 domain-containing protein n=1 Tax=Hymenobacter negativus TaxID=2795026 RepID=A0ABS0Q4J2_9BACT|nr:MULTISPECIES: DUF4136 domain-containing protein [Bacteria]MBH8557586.1 DUF4136 domain-containing protein [Hymenobacter negativus]MBH8567882.1 DUF4136 domain-containing protein [Hymenobacter negativus]MBR7207618.1 DUF4136 domain-containing protein [Microvirga sp. STS02]
MKPTITLLVLALLALTGCMATREARVDSDYSYRGNFRHYRTYDFVTGTGLTSDSSALGQSVREAIQQRFLAQGYRRAKRRPDMLVNFRVYQGDMKFHGFQQEDLSQWIKRNIEETDDTPKEDRQGYEPIRLLLAEGTLLVTLIDVKTNRAVWNGYASGVTVPEGPMGEVVLRRSVRSILDRYRVFTEEFANGNTSPSEASDTDR